MKKMLLVLLACLPGIVQADNTAYPDSGEAFPDTVLDQAIDSHDPCTVFLCMSGMLYGENPDECNGPRRTFFSIVKKKHGHFHPWRTLNARKAFLGNCPTAPGDIVGKILDKYGRVR